MLNRLIATPRFPMRLKGQPGTVAIFDNFATQHHAIGDRVPQARVMHRVTIARCCPPHPGPLPQRRRGRIRKDFVLLTSPSPP
jgi:taurine dioxygenase